MEMWTCRGREIEKRRDSLESTTEIKGNCCRLVVGEEYKENERKNPLLGKT